MPNYDSVEAGILMEGMTSDQKLQFHREMTDAWRDPKKAKRLKRWLGGFGAHHFYLGNQSRGMKSALLFWTTIPAIMALFEGDIRKRTERVNSDLARRIAMRIKGSGPAFPPIPTTHEIQQVGVPTRPQPPFMSTGSIPANESPQALPPQSAYAATSPKSNARRWVVVGLGGFAALVLVSTVLALFVGNAKERSDVTGTVAASTPGSGNAQLHNSDAAPKQSTVPDVQVYVAPDAESVVKAAGLTEDAIKEAVQQGLSKRRIASIPDNAVIEGLEDWVSVRFTIDHSAASDSQLALEMSVRNGASANNQLIRWQETNAIETTDRPNEIVAALERLMDNLKGDFNTSEYKAGRMNQPSQ